MTTYIALLRGINMAGHKVIKMDALRECFESMRLRKVRTYIQSGNVLFESSEFDEPKLCGRINKALMKQFGHDIAVMLRTKEELQNIVELNPFKSLKKNSMPFVTFLPDSLKKNLKLPIVSSRKDLELITLTGREFFSVGHLVNGRRGFPNTFIEKEFNLLATTRNWNTVNKLAKLTGQSEY
ncbi:MAG TPA: DUF1697 domain-containing protein [candidate division Zixibacteria bacterium]|nr:DUF1697 domain-containing protein [candidate division Zixibacteria bacterium]